MWTYSKHCLRTGSSLSTVCSILPKLHGFVREIAHIYGDTDDSVLCSHCVKRLSNINQAFVDMDTESLSETSGFGSDYDISDDEDDVSQLKILVELTTGRRIYPVTEKIEESINLPARYSKDKTKRRKRKAAKILKRTKHKEPEKDPAVEKRRSKISAKFKEVEIKLPHSSQSDRRKHTNKSAKF